MLKSQTVFNTNESRIEKMKRLQRIDENITKTLQGIRVLYTVDELEGSRKLVSVLDELLNNDDWESSLLLRTAKKHLNSLKEEAKQLTNELNGETISLTKEKNSFVKEGHVKIYISLYQAHGADLKPWHNLLKSLTSYSMSRPVYNNEEHIREIIRSKPEKQRHGYVVVTIPKDGIIHFENPTLDKFGHKLLTLEEGIVHVENIIEFVHANEKHYMFYDDGLTLLK